MKILHIITGLNRGGAENALYRLLKADADPSRFHVISLLDDGVYGSKFRQLGVRVTTLGMRSPLESPKALASLIQILRETRPQVVQTWMYHADLLGGIASKLVGVPVCWGVRQSDLTSKFAKRSTRATARLCAWLSASIPQAIVVCAVLAEVKHREFGYADKFTLIPNGVDTDQLRPDSANGKLIRNELGLQPDAKVIGHISRADSIKDHRTLFRMFARVADKDADAILVLAGPGLTFSERYLTDIGIPTDLRGRILALGPRNDVSKILNAMDVFILSSAAEGFPNVVVEAMACGVPCVVTDVGDAAMIVGDTGWVRPVGDADGLADDILAALTEASALHRERAKRARERIVAHYSVERMASAYDQLWHRVRGG